MKFVVVLVLVCYIYSIGKFNLVFILKLGLLVEHSMWFTRAYKENVQY